MSSVLQWVLKQLIGIGISGSKDRELNNIGKANRKGLAFGRDAFGDGRDFRPNAKPLPNYRLYLILIPKQPSDGNLRKLSTCLFNFCLRYVNLAISTRCDSVETDFIQGGKIEKG